MDVNLLRKTQDWTIQEAFLKCLEDAGIDTSEFRKGIAKINNYGIINSGKIEGNVKAEHSFAKGAAERESSGGNAKSNVENKSDVEKNEV